MTDFHLEATRPAVAPKFRRQIWPLFSIPKETQGLLVSGGGGTALQGFGTARYGGSLGSSVHYRAYATGFARDGAELPAGVDAEDGWQLGQGGFKLAWRVPSPCAPAATCV